MTYKNRNYINFIGNLNRRIRLKRKHSQIHIYFTYNQKYPTFIKDLSGFY